MPLSWRHEGRIFLSSRKNCWKPFIVSTLYFINLSKWAIFGSKSISITIIEWSICLAILHVILVGNSWLHSLLIPYPVGLGWHEHWNNEEHSLQGIPWGFLQVLPGELRLIIICVKKYITDFGNFFSIFYVFEI